MPTARDWTGALRFYGLFAVAYFAFTSVAFAQYYIPSGSMRPTLEVGDRVLVNKFAYGWSRYSLPLLVAERTPVQGRIMADAPKRGDVIVFRRPDEPTVLIKRVVALPGETVSMRGGQLYVDGRPVALEADADVLITEDRQVFPAARQSERLPGARPHLLYDSGAGPADDFGPYLVRPECFFVLGDNRDASADSRYWGCVPMDNIVGRAEVIGWTFAWRHPDPYRTRLPGRLWRGL